MLAQNSTPSSQTFDVEKMRQFYEDTHEKSNAKLIATFKGTLEERIVRTSSAEIPISIYTPLDVNKGKLGIFFHGGGWIGGSRKSHHVLVNQIADATKTVWISVEYRRAPEFKYPTWLDDASDVTKYIIQNKTSYGVDSSAKVGVAGDSAGGTITASLARTVKGIDFHILVYAALDILRQTASYEEFKDEMYDLTPELMDWLMTNAFRSSDDYKDPRANVLINTSFEGLPPCLFILADLDPVRDGNLEYQKLLERAGVSTRLVLVKGVIHGFFGLPGIFPQACAEAIATIEDFMKSI